MFNVEKYLFTNIVSGNVCTVYPKEYEFKEIGKICRDCDHKKPIFFFISKSYSIEDERKLHI